MESVVIDIRHGPWQESLTHVDECGSLITDPPYGERTHEGHDKGGPQIMSATGQQTRRELSYSAWTRDDVYEFVDHWEPKVRWWVVAMTSHDLFPHWESSLKERGRYVFAPVPIIMHRPRLLGDGPSSAAVWMVVARRRTREAMSWGCLPGWYKPGLERGTHIGGKPLNLMRSIVADYSAPGELIVDPCAGYGTTLIAAAELGCPAIGAESDRVTFDKAQARIAKGYTLGVHPREKRLAPKPDQRSLF